MASPTSAKSDVAAAKDTADGAPRAASVQWHDEDMRTHFANVVNVQSTREQFDLFFGTNRTWNIKDQDAVAVDLSNRLILTPFAPSGCGAFSATCCASTRPTTESWNWIADRRGLRT
jgi:hypothetical protein